MDKETAIRKILKCLALGKSSEPHEAARAMEQASALMKQFDIDHPELLASGISEQTAKSRASRKPPKYEAALATIVGNKFACQILFRTRQSASSKTIGTYVFVGASTSSTVASYTFEVLARRLAAARAEYIKTRLTRYTKNKIAAADQFCLGWVHAVSKAIGKPDTDESVTLAITAYMDRTYSQLEDMKSTSRALTNKSDASHHISNGWREGQKERVHQAVNAGQSTLQLGG